MMVEEARTLPEPAPFAAIAFVLPWAVASAFLPDPWRLHAWALLALLAVLLMAAAAWTLRAAEERGLDASAWAFAAAVTFGWAMLVLLLRPRHARADAGAAGPMTYVCTECGRRGAFVETFCHGCGAA